MQYSKHIIKLAKNFSVKYAAEPVTTTNPGSTNPQPEITNAVKEFQKIVIRIYNMLSTNYNTLLKYSKPVDRDYLLRFKQVLDSVGQAPVATGDFELTKILTRGLETLGGLSESAENYPAGGSKELFRLKEILSNFALPNMKNVLRAEQPNAKYILASLDRLRRVENLLQAVASSYVIRPSRPTGEEVSATKPAFDMAPKLTPEQEERMKKMEW